MFVPDTVHHGPANEQGHEVAGASPEGRDLVSGVILSEAIAQHPRRGGILILPLLVILRSAATKDLGLESGKTKSENQHRDPSGGEAALRMTALFVILSAAVCHPEAGTIADRVASPQ